MTRRSSVLAALLAAAVLSGTAATTRPALAAGAQQHRAVTILGPGESGFVSDAGQARGMVTGNPGDYGEHIDDQRVPYWTGQFKPGDFRPDTGPAESPVPGVRIRRDAFGVPAVYGDNGYDVWYGAGYAAGQDRLFLADAVRRMGRGTFAELVGSAGVPLDVATRTTTYSQADYDAMFTALPPESREAIAGYSAGIQAWIQVARTDPTKLPAEYTLLGTLPADWTTTDTLAAGVLITRTVASAGGTEFDQIAELRRLQDKLGPAGGRKAFQDAFWLQDEKALATVPEADGRFDNDTTPAADREQVFNASADYALSLPPELATGPGTGTYPTPATIAGLSGVPAQVRTSLARAVESLDAFRAGLHGGSYAIALAGSRTASGKPLLESAPELGYSYPSLLFEVEVHGGGYDARGATVPGLPTVGIGYGNRVGWALTTGESKTIDSFVETTRVQDGRLQYRHDNAWVDADCRTETVRYRASAQGLPVGPPVESVAVPVCRTVHGPIVAQVGDQARSVQLAMYGREVETVTGILAWNRAKTLDEFAAAVAQVTWNENVTYADADGHIAYWHPGLYPRRNPEVDERFPTPGDGSRDWQGLLSFGEMPHSIDPAQGWLANWNNKPAVGWVGGFIDPASGRPAGPATRYGVLADLLSTASGVTFDGLKGIDWTAGTTDQRARTYLPLLTALDRSGLTSSQATALTLLDGYGGAHYGPGAGTSPGDVSDASVTDGPAATLFGAIADRMPEVVLGGVLPAATLADADTTGPNHPFDASPADNLVLRVLDPSSSALALGEDYAGGRSNRTMLLAALDRAVSALTDQYGDDPAAWRRQHPRSQVASLTGVIGPSTTTPYEDRGTYIHLLDFGSTAEPSTDVPEAPYAVLLPVLAAAAVLLVRRRSSYRT